MGKSKRRKPNSGNPAKTKIEGVVDQHVYVRTERTEDDRSWMVTVDFNPDLSLALVAAEVETYWETLIAAGARAEYDAAVLAQMEKMTDLQHAQILVMNLRADRPPLPVVKGWDFRPGVSAANRKGFVAAYLDGEEVFQFTPEGAREHALYVREAIMVADLDNQYLAALHSSLELERELALQVVAGLAKFR